MGTALALSVERRVVKGVDAWEIDKSMLIRGSIIALLDLTIISLGSGHWNFGVLYAIGLTFLPSNSAFWHMPTVRGWYLAPECQSS
jgi:hypothetical protein